MDMFTKGTATAVAGVVTAVGSALCCAGPVVLVALGVSGAGLSSTFEPLRPYLLGSTALFLGGGFFLLHREEERACDADTTCASPKARKRMKFILWIATAIAVVFATFPSWQNVVL